MATTTNLSSLVINYLTQAQYDAAAAGGTLNENQLYLTPAETLAAVATSGSYNDLSNKPTIPDVSGKIDTAGTGLSKSGTTLNHSNSITAQTTQGIYPIAIDAQGHITSYGNAFTPTSTELIRWTEV